MLEVTVSPDAVVLSSWTSRDLRFITRAAALRLFHAGPA